MKHWTKLSILISAILGWQLWDIGLFPQMTSENLRGFLGLIAQISATMLGFLLAALAILASISGHRLLRNMQKTGHYQVLLERFLINTVAYAAAMMAAIAAFLFEPYLCISSLISSIIFVFATLLLCDIGYRLWLVLKNLGPENP